jgi:2-polyprenyl-3-methyl-5-hydroxy-6-metoxy-1,4-benzoquinol methylase
MSDDEKHEFPHWEDLYREQEIESLPWFNPELDDDLEKALGEFGLRGGSALDLGTGPGTQAIHLARLGFAVTATDISEAAIRYFAQPAWRAQSRQRIAESALIRMLSAKPADEAPPKKKKPPKERNPFPRVLAC